MIEKDYLHYYIGQQCKWCYSDGELKTSEMSHVLTGSAQNGNISLWPILRRLEDITDEEKIEFYDCNHEHNHKWNHKDKLNHFAIMRRRDGDMWVAKEFHYLIKQGFDLFGLIDAGLAIDKKTLNP